MKKFKLISIIILISIITLFAANSIFQTNEPKVEAFNRSISFEKENNYKKAIDELTRIYEANKNDYLVNLRLGWLYYKDKNYSNSIKYYGIAKNLKPSSIEPLLGITLPFAAWEKWSDVKSQYEFVLQKDKNNFTANLRLGQIYLNNKDYYSAKKYLETAYNFFPGEYEPNLSLGWTYYYLGDKVKAKNLLTNALMLNPGDELALEGLGLLK